MTGTEVRAGFEELWPPGEMNRLCRPRGVIERQRTLHLAMLVRALVISVGTPGGTDQVDILRAYLESEVPRITRDRESEVDRLRGGCLGQSSRLQGLPQTATQTGAALTISE